VADDQTTPALCGRCGDTDGRPCSLDGCQNRKSATEEALPRPPWRQRTVTFTYGQILAAFVAFNITGAILDTLRWIWK
jgi:hypothetical protein